MGDLMGKLQTCAISDRMIYNKLHLIRYILERVSKIPDKGGALVNLDKSKAFDMVDHWYLTVVLQVVRLGTIFHGEINTMYSNIEFIV